MKKKTGAQLNSRSQSLKQGKTITKGKRPPLGVDRSSSLL
ncbi:unnamed protein product [Coffea canephora]|uniref:Uncharacterized protein n=1 Tax=Coffea canephora TaxID=49390 RepID=A0A068UBV0_COFCA|nr:unnamed protein product [Coffea canephora]